MWRGSIHENPSCRVLLLRKMSGLEEEEITGGENCLMSFIICTPPNIIRVTKLKTR
jgi:hypothetical protein